MFLTLSPPYFGNKSPRIVNKTAKNGNFRGVFGNFFKGGRKTKQYYEHKQQQPILPIFSLAALIITISASDYIQQLSLNYITPSYT